MKNIKDILIDELKATFSKLQFRVDERYDTDIAHIDDKLVLPVRSFFRSFPF